MVRAVALAGFIALAAGQGLALPTVETVPQMGEWQETAAETQTAPIASVTETIEQTEGMATTMNSGTTRVMGTQEQPQPVPVQEAVLDAIMKEMQTVFKNALAVPGFETMDSAAENVKQIVDRVRERLNSTFTETDVSRAPMATVTALRGVTSDFLKEIMVQEAVIETLWAVLRDSQARPWIANEQQAMHVAATQAVQGFLTRMHDRLRATGFTDEEIVKMMPRPERNLGRRSYGYGYGYPAYGYRSYYGYPSSSYGYGYPSYRYSGYYGSPAYYGYPAYRSAYWFRRLGEPATPEPATPPPPMGPAPVPVNEPMGPPSLPTGPAGPMGPNPPEMMGPMGASERNLYGWYGNPYGLGYRSWGYPAYYGYPAYRSAYWFRRLGEPATPEPATPPPPMGPAPVPVNEPMGPPSPPTGPAGPMGPNPREMMGPMGASERNLYGWYGNTYGLGYSSWGYPVRSWGYAPWSYSYGPYWRRLEVPDIEVPQTASTMTSEKMTETTPATTGSTTGFTQNTFRRVGETRAPMTTGSYDSTPATETPSYPEQTANEIPSGAWENTTF